MDDFFSSVGWPHRLNSWGLNGGETRVSGRSLTLWLPAGRRGYANAQLDDTRGRSRRHYPWRPGIALDVRARFSRPLAGLAGTAGFGFWNAPFGDPQQRLPALPQAIWFFIGGPRSNFPLNPAGPGRGFYAATLDAGRWQAVAMAPLAPPVILLNRWPRFRQTVWPRIQAQLGMSFQGLDEVDLTAWHRYQIRWSSTGSTFLIDGRPMLQTAQSPRGPLGFVCWIDNQFLAVTPTGKIRGGTVPLAAAQALEIADLTIEKLAENF